MSLVSQTSLPAARSAADQRDEVVDRRDALFRETGWQQCQRVALGTAWSLLPRRIGKLWPLTRVWLSDLMAPATGFPDAEVRGRQRGLRRDGSRPLAGDPDRRLSARALPQGTFRSAQMGIAERALRPLLRRVSHLTPHPLDHAAGQVQCHLRSRLRGGDQGLRRAALRPLAFDLDHAAHHAQLRRALRRGLRPLLRGVEQGRRAGRRRLRRRAWRRLRHRVAILP